MQPSFPLIGPSRCKVFIWWYQESIEGEKWTPYDSEPSAEAFAAMAQRMATNKARMAELAKEEEPAPKKKKVSTEEKVNPVNPSKLEMDREDEFFEEPAPFKIDWETEI